MEVQHSFGFPYFVFLLVFVSYAPIKLEVWFKRCSNNILITMHLVQYTSELEKHPKHMQNAHTFFALTPLKVRY